MLHASIWSWPGWCLRKTLSRHDLQGLLVLLLLPRLLVLLLFQGLLVLLLFQGLLVLLPFQGLLVLLLPRLLVLLLLPRLPVLLLFQGLLELLLTGIVALVKGVWEKAQLLGSRVLGYRGRVHLVENKGL
jgi:hypothetical protein